MGVVLIAPPPFLFSLLICNDYCRKLLQFHYRLGKQDGHIVVSHIWKIVESANERCSLFLWLGDLVKVQMKVSTFPVIYRILGEV